MPPSQLFIPLSSQATIPLTLIISSTLSVSVAIEFPVLSFLCLLVFLLARVFRVLKSGGVREVLHVGGLVVFKVGGLGLLGLCVLSSIAFLTASAESFKLLLIIYSWEFKRPGYFPSTLFTTVSINSSAHLLRGELELH